MIILITKYCLNIIIRPYQSISSGLLVIKKLHEFQNSKHAKDDLIISIRQV